MSRSLRILRVFIAALITLCVCFTCLPFSRTVSADDGANYYACKENPDAEDVTVYRGADASAIPNGWHCFAVLVNNRSQTYVVEDFIKASYQDDDPDNNIPVIANQSNIAAEGLFDLRFTLLGDSLVRWNNSNGYVTNNNYRYTGDPYDFSGIENYIAGLGDAIEKTYSFRVGASTTIYDPMDLDYIMAAGSAKLTIDHSGSEGHTEITVNKLELLNNSQVIIAGGNEPNGLNIKKELIASDGSITGAEGSVLLIEAGATVKGGITLYAPDGTTAETGNDFSNIRYLSTESYTYRTTGYDSPRWVRDGEPEPQDPAGIYVAFSDALFESFTYQYAGGEVEEIPPEGNIAPADADSITLTFVPKTGTVSAKQGDLTPTVTNNSFTLYKRDYDWTKGPCYVEVTAVRESGIYFHCEDGLVSEINFELGESSTYTVSGNYIPLTVYENASGINFHVVTPDESEPISTYVSTDGGLTYGTGNFDREFYITKNGDSWADVYDVYIRRGAKKYPGMYFYFDRSENSPIDKIEYSLDDGALTELTEEFLSYDIYENNTKVKFVITPKEGIDNLDLHIDWDQYFIGEMVPYQGFTFENNELTLIKPANESEWGVIYDIGINVPGDPVPGGSFEVRFPNAPQVVDGVQCRFNENEQWATAAADGDDLYFNIERNRTAVTFKLLKRENSAPLSITVESKANAGADPVVMNGITLDDDNQFTLVKPEGEGANWEGNYIVTITAEGGDTPTPTPDPGDDELARYGGYDVRLDGYVGVTYYLALDQGIRDSDTKVTFTYDSSIPELARQEITLDEDRHVYFPNMGDFYAFDVKVAPSEMTKTISVTLTNKDYSVSFDPFTVRAYVDNYTKLYTGTVADLANAIKNYGYYSQLKFGSSDPVFAEDALTLVDPQYDAVHIGDIQDGISYYGSSVVFLSGNKLKHYFTIESNPGLYTFKINGQDVTKAAAGGNLYSVSTGELTAAHLNQGVTVEIFYNGSKIYEFTYSPMNYAKSVVNNDKSTPEMKNLAKAFAMYYTAANAYNTSGNQ